MKKIEPLTMSAASLPGVKVNRLEVAIACPASQRPGLQIRFQHDFYAIILLVSENIVATRRVVERHPMSYHETRIDLAFFDPFKQWLHISLNVCLPGF